MEFNIKERIKNLFSNLKRQSIFSFHGYRLVFWFVFSLWLTAIIVLLLDLNHWHRIEEIVETGIAVIGALFAVLAMIDARRSFKKAEEVLESVESYRMNFHDVLEEMRCMVQSATKNLDILIPTPAYGYLFGQTELSKQFLSALEDFLEREETELRLVLVLGDIGNSKEMIPQRYLQRAYNIQSSNLPMSNGISANEYTDIVRKAFSTFKEKSSKVKLWVLNADPNVRIIISDYDDEERRAGFLSFAQLDPDNVEQPFESKGFRSNRRELVGGILDLINVYRSEGERKYNIDDIKKYYEVLLM